MTFLLKSEKTFIFGMNEEDKIMRSYLFNVVKGLVFFVEMDKPGETSWIGGDNVMFALFCFSGDVAPVRYVFNSKRRL